MLVCLYHSMHHESWIDLRPHAQMEAGCGRNPSATQKRSRGALRHRCWKNRHTHQLTRPFAFSKTRHPRSFLTFAAVRCARSRGLEHGQDWSSAAAANPVGGLRGVLFCKSRGNRTKTVQVLHVPSNADAGPSVHLRPAAGPGAALSEVQLQAQIGRSVLRHPLTMSSATFVIRPLGVPLRSVTISVSRECLSRGTSSQLTLLGCRRGASSRWRSSGRAASQSRP